MNSFYFFFLTKDGFHFYYYFLLTALAAAKSSKTAAILVAGERAAAAAVGSGSTLGFSKLLGKVVGVTGVGKRIRSHFGPSNMKVDNITQFAREILKEIKTQFAHFEASTSTGIQKIANVFSSEIKNENDRLSEEKSVLNKELHQLTEWSKKLTKSTERMQEVRKRFDKLKCG